MKKCVSEQSFDEEKVEDDSESSNEYSDNDNNGDHLQSKPSLIDPSWPQSYRESIDLYSSVSCPSLDLSELSSTFLSSPLRRRLTPDVLPSLSKPLIEDVTRSWHCLLPEKVTDDANVSFSHGPPISRQCSYSQSVLNGVNALCGVGILSIPYAVKEGGWAGLSMLFIFALLCYYTGILLRRCLDSQRGLETYPDIGQAAFGSAGRVAIAIILYVELYACCVEHIILESDNMSSLFPNAHLNLGVFELNSSHLFAVLMALVVLPTVWLRDLRILSYISAGGVVASILVVACLFWAGLVDHVGFETKGQTTLNLPTLPVAIGLYSFCYSGHAVYPNIYMSMENPRQYPSVLLTSFGICTALYAAVAVLGYMMFGESIQSQFTLNMPQHLVASKIAVWTTVVSPLTKYGFAMLPVAKSLEELLPSAHAKSYIYPIIIRTMLVVSTLVIALIIPFFGLVMALIGSSLTMLITLILPCACYLSILRGKINLLQGSMCILVIGVGIVSSAVGTYSAIAKIIQNLS